MTTRNDEWKMTASRLLQELAGNDEFLDLGGAFVDAQRADVAIELLDDVAAHETRAAVNLHRAVDNAPGSFGGKQLRLARFARHTPAAGVFQESSAIDKQSSGI